MGKISIVSFFLGGIVYITYLVMIVIDFKTSGFDTQSFSMLILLWAFENSAYCVTKKEQIISIKKVLCLVIK